MWRGYEYQLGLYLLAGIQVLKERGKLYLTVKEKILTEMEKHSNFELPPWFGDKRFHSAHRAALLAKNYDWYQQFGWKELPKIEYYWPV